MSSFAETSGRPRVFWDPLIHPVIVTVAAEPAGLAAEVADLFDWRAVGDLASILKLPDETEHLLLSDGQRQLQLAVTEGTLLEGPVRLRCTLRGMRDIERKALSLRRLSLCRRLGRLPRTLYAREPAAARWVDKLRALDAVAAGATRREIAAGLIGEGRVAAEWSGRSDHLLTFACASSAWSGKGGGLLAVATVPCCPDGFCPAEPAWARGRPVAG